jgi:histidinol-phosphate aminotransferase
MLAQVNDLRELRDRLAGALTTMGFEAAESDANCVLFGRFEDRQAAWSKLLAKGVIVRQAGPPAWLRVSVGTEAETLAFLRALAQVREELE